MGAISRGIVPALLKCNYRLRVHLCYLRTIFACSRIPTAGHAVLIRPRSMTVVVLRLYLLPIVVVGPTISLLSAHLNHLNNFHLIERVSGYLDVLESRRIRIMPRYILKALVPSSLLPILPALLIPSLNSLLAQDLRRCHEPVPNPLAALWIPHFAYGPP